MIVVVGNRDKNPDRSAEIDSADLVVRVNKLCNLGTGNTGKRTDWVVIRSVPLYWAFSPRRRHWDAVQKASKIWLMPWLSNDYHYKQYLTNFEGLPWENIPDSVAKDYRYMTTTGIAVRMVEVMFPYQQIGLAGGDIGEEWIRTRTTAVHTEGEARYYDKLIKEGKLIIL